MVIQEAKDILGREEQASTAGENHRMQNKYQELEQEIGKALTVVVQWTRRREWRQEGTDTDPRVLEKQELQQPTYVALSYINRFMTDAARREQESLKKKIQPKLSLTLSSTVSRGNVSTPPRHSSGSLTPPVTPPITPSSSFRSSTPTGSEYDEEEVDYEESDSDESWTTESAISSEAILSSMCMNGGDEKPFACPVPGCKKRYKNVNGIKYHAKNGHRTQIRVRKPFKCRCGKSYKTAQGLRHHTINFHPPVSAEIIRKMQQ
ncbi:PREDICTED: juxtaposed with another zinc finger protein 1 [Chaetura pelagica]|uniref:juxtaposed with another zinc finger protein 1 n=1 Tax=Chaetura pelagica TaxID=8897 RepID=UPI000523EAE8|nr:PREDICTED: juxtaposed with another zinc finger protein 1 [Chaetura pelagica]